MDNQYKILSINNFPNAHNVSKRATYIWKDQYKNVSRYNEVYNQYDDQHSKYNLSELVYLNILPAPENPPFDEYIDKIQKYDGSLHCFFKEVLTADIDEELSGLSTNTFSSAILPKSKLSEIERVIESYGFQNHLGFFIHLICRIQNVYLNEIEFYAQPDEVKRRKKLPSQVDDLIKVIKGHKEIGLTKKSISRRTEKIKFVIGSEFNSTETIIIEDYGLILGIIDATRDYWCYGNTKDWEESLKQVAFDEEQMTKIDYFTERLSVVLFQFVTQTGFFQLEKVKYSSKAGLFVWNILNLAGIKTYKKEGREHEIYIDDSEIKSLIKTYIHRHKVAKKPFFYDINPDLEGLKRFFEPKFIESVHLRLQPSEYEVAHSICAKYKIIEIIDDIALILKCLSYYKSMLGFQNHGTLKSKENPDLQSFLKFQEVSETDYNMLDSISFKFKGDAKEHKISDNSLKMILLDAIHVHKSINPEEFSVDIWKTDFKTNATDGSTEFIDGNRLNHPGERFLSRFTTAFASYLESKGIVGGNQLDEERNMFYIINSCLISKKLISNSASNIFFQKIKRWILLNKNLSR